MLKYIMEYLIVLFILGLAVPIGYTIRHFTKDELKQGKKYFKIIWISGIILSLIALTLNFNIIIKKTAIFSLIFISIVSFISWKNGQN